jgi:hypothetical protein
MAGKAKVTINTSDFDKLVVELSNMSDKVMTDAGKYYKSITPIKSGNARRRTTQKGDVIKSDYAYAQRLDSGYSKQAPGGMTDPTIDYINKLVTTYTRRIK